MTSFKLRRVRIMNISIDGIPNGKWRYLSDEESCRDPSVCVKAQSAQKKPLERMQKVAAFTKATDAKLHDARREAKRDKEREGKRDKMKTYSGHGADEYRRGPSSKRRQRQTLRMVVTTSSRGERQPTNQRKTKTQS